MPIIHQVDQRSAEWDRLKLGIPSASNFDKIITPGGKESEQWAQYAYSLIAERILGRRIDAYTSPWMERGAELEPDAISWYEFDRDTETEAIGWITTDDGKIGCSPDRLVGDDGLVELKCPAPATQIKYLLTGEIDKKYKPQLQGQLYVTERQWVDIIAYHPELPRTVIRASRDDAYIDKLDKQLKEFVRYLDGVMEKILAINGQPSTPKAALRDMLHASLEATR